LHEGRVENYVTGLQRVSEGFPSALSQGEREERGERREERGERRERGGRVKKEREKPKFNK
jgi:hypothetical protein